MSETDIDSHVNVTRMTRFHGFLDRLRQRHSRDQNTFRSGWRGPSISFICTLAFWSTVILSSCSRFAIYNYRERNRAVTVFPIKIAFHNNGGRRWDLDSPKNTVLNASSHSLSKVAIVAAGRLIPHIQDPTTSITQADLFLNSILLLLPPWL